MDAPVAAAPSPLTHREAQRIVWGILLPVFIGSLDSTILASALPTIGRDLGDVHLLPWLITAYLIASTAVTPLYGKISDIHGRRRTVYCAAKHAMEGFTKAMAIELAPHNIRVNSIGPTFLETPMTRPFFENKAFRDEVLSKIKLGRLGQLEELTGAIVFLASAASSLMTGSALVIDGGWTAE